MKQSAKNSTAVQPLLFKDLFEKDTVMQFAEEQQSNDSGLILVGALDRSIGLTEMVARAILDKRHPSKIEHSVLDFIRQRAYAMLGGYEDTNDAARLRDDPTFRLLLGRSVDPEDTLASQPTLSRFENHVGIGSLMRASLALGDFVIASLRKRYKHTPRVTIDLDPTDDPTHGQQLFSFFNGYYDNWCYLPLIATLTFHDRWGREEPEQHLACILLRKGNAKAYEGADFILRHLVPRLRKAFPSAKVRARMDGGFATPTMFTLLEEELGVEYVINLPKNAVLKRMAERLMKAVRLESRRTGATACQFGEVDYAAKSWRDDSGKLKKRRVVIKAEVVLSPREPDKEPKDNPRFVVTNLRNAPQSVYKTIYCRRGDVENRIKELHDGVFLDRTSCSSFHANQMRVLLSATAYVLAQQFRLRCANTEAQRWQVPTLRERLFKFGAVVKETTRRIVFKLAKSGPHVALLAELGRRMSIPLKA